MVTILLIILIVAVLVINPLIIKRLVTNVPNVWDGAFKIVLDDSQVISYSFGIEDEFLLDIPKGRLIKEIVIEQVPKGFVPMISSREREFETRLVKNLFSFRENEGLVDLRFEIINPETLPAYFRFVIGSNQRILNKKQRSSSGLFLSREFTVRRDKSDVES